MDHESRKPVLLNSEINQNPEKSYFGSLIRLQHSTEGPLEVQGLRHCFLCKGHEFHPWSRVAQCGRKVRKRLGR